MNDTPRTTIVLPFTPEDIRTGRVVPADDVTTIADAQYNLLLRIHAAAIDALTEIASGSLPDQPAASGLGEREWAVQHIAKLRRLARHGLTAASNIRFNETPSPKLTECTFCRSWHSKPCGEGCHWSL